MAQVANDCYGCAVLEKGLSYGEERQVCWLGVGMNIIESVDDKIVGGLTRVTGFWQFWRVWICFDHVDHIVQIGGYGSMLKMIYHAEVDEHLEWAVRPLMF